MRGVPVLMYHALEDAQHPAGAADAGEQRYVLQVSQFREQMDYLCREGYRTILIGESAGLAELHGKAIVLTFDDGHRSNYMLALPILKEYGFRAHFFITTSWIGSDNYLDEQQIVALQQAGMAIGSHGVSHRFLSDLAPADIDCELFASRRTLEAITGNPVRSLSLPGGRQNCKTRSLAEVNGFTAIFSSEPGYLGRKATKNCIPRLALTADMTIERYRCLLRGSGFRRLLLRYALLRGCKAMLGNGGYIALRNLIIGRRQLAAGFRHE